YFQKTKIRLTSCQSYKCSKNYMHVIEAGSSQTVTALVGEDVILPCLLEPAADVVSKSLEWGRLDLEPRFVHVWHEGQNLLVNQNPAYRGRTSLSTEKLKHGDLSLSLSALKHSDNGQYRCYFPSQGKTSTVELLVGSVSSPVIAEININSSIVVLQCESKGWYPEPDLLWLDAEGKILSAGPTETVRGPDDLYTVSSRVTIKVTGDCLTHEIIISRPECFAPTSISAARISIILITALVFICAAIFGLWKWRQNRIEGTRKRKQEYEALQQNTQTVLNKTDEVMNEMMYKKKEVEKHKVEIRKQLEREREREINQLEQQEES
uniref:Ig-like domain-containing protein n=1 Tax=Anabas testudineus TaxID=64144 RepID=A0A3Q1K7D7_ANATE